MRAISFPSVVIDDLDQFGAAVAPDEADAPLIVDSDAMLAASVASQGFEAITGQCPQVHELAASSMSSFRTVTFPIA
jgi:hypothetical protein